MKNKKIITLSCAILAILVTIGLSIWIGTEKNNDKNNIISSNNKNDKTVFDDNIFLLGDGEEMTEEKRHSCSVEKPIGFIFLPFFIINIVPLMCFLAPSVYVFTRNPTLPPRFQMGHIVSG